MWRLDLTDPGWDEAAAAAVLTRPELERAQRAAPDVRRRRLLLRAALRVVLGRALALPAGQVPLAVLDGRPYLAGPGAPEVSCSASAGVGLVALTWGGPIGIDVQRHDEAEARTADDEGWLAPPEQRALAALPPAARWPAVTRCWTQKEAVLKGRGDGLRHPPRAVVTPVAPAGRSGGWRLAPVPVPPGFVASLAVRSARPVRVPGVALLVPADLR